MSVKDSPEGAAEVANNSVSLSKTRMDEFLGLSGSTTVDFSVESDPRVQFSLSFLSTRYYFSGIRGVAPRCVSCESISALITPK